MIKIYKINMFFACWPSSSAALITEESLDTITGIFRLGGNDRASVNHYMFLLPLCL